MATSSSPQALNVGFNTPFQEQIDFLRAKLRLPTERWDDIQRSAHDRAFIVAGAAKADLLADLQASLVQAATDGRGLDAWRKAFRQIVKDHGWDGWTGQGTKGGEAWRTRVIYQTNMATSYAAGRYRQLTEPSFLALRPFWRYIHSDSVMHPRPMHLSWHGLTLAHDHPFWQTHFPPNGWGCQCRVTAVSQREGAASARAGLGEPPEGWDQIVDKTQAPPGIDKGFNYAPGATWHPNLDKYPEPVARQVVAANLRDGVFERWVNTINNGVASELATGNYQGMDTPALLNALRVKLGEQGAMPLAVLDAETKDLLGAGTLVLKVSDYDLIKQAVSRNGAYDALPYMDMQEVLDAAPYIARQANGRFVLIPSGRKVPIAVIHRTANGTELYLKSYREGFGPNEIARSQRRDTVLRGLNGG